MSNSLDSSGNFVISGQILASDWTDLISFYNKATGFTYSQTQTKGGQILASDWEALRQAISAISDYTITVPDAFVKGQPIVSTTWGVPVSSTPVGTTYQYTKTTTLTVAAGKTSLVVNWLIAAGTTSYAMSSFQWAKGSQGGYYENYTPAFTVKSGDTIVVTVGVKASASSTLAINGTVVLTATGGTPPVVNQTNGTAGTPNGQANDPTPVLTNSLGSFGGGGNVVQSGFNMKATNPTYGYCELVLS